MKTECHRSVFCFLLGRGVTGRKNSLSCNLQAFSGCLGQSCFQMVIPIYQQLFSCILSINHDDMHCYMPNIVARLEEIAQFFCSFLAVIFLKSILV